MYRQTSQSFAAMAVGEIVARLIGTYTDASTL